MYAVFLRWQDQICGDIRQRLQDKRTRKHAGMWQYQAGFADFVPPTEQHIQINRARSALPLKRAISSKRLLYAHARGKHVLRCQRATTCDHGVKKVSARPLAHRDCFIHLASANIRQNALVNNGAQRAAQQFHSVTHVRAKGDGDKFMGFNFGVQSFLS